MKSFFGKFFCKKIELSLFRRDTRKWRASQEKISITSEGHMTSDRSVDCQEKIGSKRGLSEPKEPGHFGKRQKRDN